METLKTAFSNGAVWALMGVAFAVILSGMGSAKGVGMASQASAGAVAENPSLFSKLLLLNLLPGTQGLYGVVVGFMVLTFSGILGGDATLSVTEGVLYFFACVPIGIGGFYSAVWQGRAVVAGIAMVSKRPNESGKAVTQSVFVELYALLAFIISLIAVTSINNMNL